MALATKEKEKNHLIFQEEEERFWFLFFFFYRFFFFYGSQSYARQSFGVDSEVSHSLYQVAVDL